MIKKRNPGEKLVAPVDKKYLPNEEKIAANAKIVHEANQAIQLELQSKREVTRDIYSTETTQILFFSDWHLGSGTVDLKSIEDRLKYAEENDNVMVVFLGDVLEAMKTAYASTIVTQTHSNVTTQVAHIRSLIRKLNEQGKILTMVSGYGGHSGSWVTEGSTYDLYQSIRGDYAIPLIQPGGRLVLRFIDPKSNKVIGVKNFDLYHAPPRGSGHVNPTAGLARSSRQKKSLRPDLSASAHTHKGAYAVELDPRGNESMFVQEGTPKGSNPELPADAMFLEKVPGGRPHPPGSGVTMRRGQDNDIQLMPTYGHDRMTLFNQAFSILDMLESRGMTEEMKGEIKAKTGETRPLIKFDHRRSKKDDDLSLLETRKRDKKDKENEEQAEIPSPEKPEDQYALLSYRVETSLPFLLFFGSHFGFGGSSADMKRFKEMRGRFIQAVQDNPHAALLLMRGLLDKTVPGRADRRQVVENQVAQFFASLGEDGRILGLMLSGEDFRSERWKSSVGKEAPFMPGTYLAKRLNTRLYNNMSQLELTVGQRNGQSLSRYKVLTVDKVGQHGSRANTFNGLRGIDALTDEEIDVVAGGHMPGAGVLLTQDPYSATPERAYVAPGHNTKWKGQGSGNQQDASPSGQAVILMPDEKLVIPVADLDSALEQHLAFYLLTGLRKAGLLEKVLSNNSGR